MIGKILRVIFAFFAVALMAGCSSTTLGTLPDGKVLGITTVTTFEGTLRYGAKYDKVGKNEDGSSKLVENERLHISGGPSAVAGVAAGAFGGSVAAGIQASGVRSAAKIGKCEGVCGTIVQNNLNAQATGGQGGAASSASNSGANVGVGVTVGTPVCNSGCIRGD